MALLFLDSFSHYATADILDKWTSISGSGPTIVGGGLCGSNVARFSGFQNILKGLNPTSNTKRGVVGFRANITTGGPVMMSIMDSTTLYHFALVHDNSRNGLNVFRGSAGGPDATLLTQTPANVITLGAWYYIEVRYFISSTVGEIEIHINGLQQVNASGLNTRGDPVFLSDDNVAAVRMDARSTADWLCGDLYVLDDQVTATDGNITFLGDTRVECQFIGGAGSHTVMVPHGAAANWQCVKDTSNDIVGAPDGDATYVASSTVGDIDTYTMNPLSVHLNQVFGVQTAVLLKKLDAGARTTGTVLRVGGTDYVQATFAPSNGSYIYDLKIFGKDPTGAAWTTTTLNAMELGQKVLT